MDIPEMIILLRAVWAADQRSHHAKEVDIRTVAADGASDYCLCELATEQRARLRDKQTNKKQ